MQKKQRFIHSTWKPCASANAVKIGFSVDIGLYLCQQKKKLIRFDKQQMFRYDFGMKRFGQMLNLNYWWLKIRNCENDHQVTRWAKSHQINTMISLNHYNDLIRSFKIYFVWYFFYHHRFDVISCHTVWFNEFVIIFRYFLSIFGHRSKVFRVGHIGVVVLLNKSATYYSRYGFS